MNGLRLLRVRQGYRWYYEKPLQAAPATLCSGLETIVLNRFVGGVHRCGRSHYEAVKIRLSFSFRWASFSRRSR